MSNYQTAPSNGLPSSKAPKPPLVNVVGNAAKSCSGLFRIVDQIEDALFGATPHPVYVEPEGTPSVFQSATDCLQAVNSVHARLEHLLGRL